MDGYRILSFHAENIKRLSVVSITPAGALVEISGKNGNGKTSVIDAIAWVLDGAANIQDQPVRKGKKDGVIEVSLGDDSGEKLLVRRNWTSGSDKKGYLKIETPEGMRPKAPQQMLDDLMGAISFDPMAFYAKNAKDQFAILRDLVTFDVDIAELDRLRDEDYNARTDRNRELARTRALLASVQVPKDAPEAPIDTKPMMDALTNADAFNADVRTRTAQREGLVTSRAESLKRNEAIKLKVQELHALAARELELVTNAEQEMATWERDPLPALVDSKSIREDIVAAEIKNSAHARLAQRKIYETTVADLELDAKRLTERIAHVEGKKREAMARAKMPIAGLSMDGDSVTFNGLPLDQASGAERLRVSTAIAAALNPKLRVIRIKNGNDLDDDGVTTIAEMAANLGLQIWMERIVPGTQSAVILEDGHIRGQEDLVAAQAATEAAQPPEVPEGETFDAQAYLEGQIRLTANANIPALESVNTVAKGVLRPFKQQLGEWNAHVLNRMRTIGEQK